MDKRTNTLRGIRITVACIFLAGISMLFMGIGADWWGWMAKLLFLPAVSRVIGSATLLNIGVVAGIILLTLVFGRIYCSVICPLGIFQDAIIWLRRQHGLIVNRINVRRAAERKRNPDKAPAESKQHPADKPVLKASVKHFAYSPERKIIRYGFLVLTVAAMIVGIQVFVSLIAPYSAYGRIVRGIAGIAGEATRTLVITGLVSLLVITACAVLGGRIWCNTLCPVGTFLGLLSRRPVFRIAIDTDKCTNCGRCVRGCKSSCIDGEKHIIDYSRCVDCFDCIGRCKEGAISFGRHKENKANEPSAEEHSVSRREFLAAGALIAGSAIKATVGTPLAAADNSTQGGFAKVIEKTAPQRSCRIVPPGALSVKNFQDKCTACQLCVSACPNDVLRPATDLSHFLQPESGYEKGFCRPECTECSKVCPSGAILPISREEKTFIHIGTAKVDLTMCFNGCGNCARHCPTGAISMIEVKGFPNPMPVVNEELCIGCGACEYLCPSRPVSAITVNGLQTHRRG